MRSADEIERDADDLLSEAEVESDPRNVRILRRMSQSSAQLAAVLRALEAPDPEMALGEGE